MVVKLSAAGWNREAWRRFSICSKTTCLLMRFDRWKISLKLARTNLTLLRALNHRKRTIYQLVNFHVGWLLVKSETQIFESCSLHDFDTNKVWVISVTLLQATENYLPGSQARIEVYRKNDFTPANYNENNYIRRVSVFFFLHWQLNIPILKLTIWDGKITSSQRKY